MRGGGNVAERGQRKSDREMENERNQDREPDFTALFLFFAHFRQRHGAPLLSRQIISHIARLTTWLSSLPRRSAFPGMVEKILLRVTAMLAEIRVAERAKLLRP